MRFFIFILPRPMGSERILHARAKSWLPYGTHSSSDYTSARGGLGRSCEINITRPLHTTCSIRRSVSVLIRLSGT